MEGRYRACARGAVAQHREQALVVPWDLHLPVHLVGEMQRRYRGDVAEIWRR